MKANLLWLVAILVLVSVGTWASRERSGNSEPPRLAAYVPTDAEKAEARKILQPTTLAAGEPERRLAFYNDLRDHMDQSAFGVLEAVADDLRLAPDNQIDRGYDLRTFYSAVGGDREFRGGGDEDWKRLIDFSNRWAEAIPASPTARIARARARVLSMSPDQQMTLSAAVDDLIESLPRPYPDPWRDETLRTIAVVSSGGQRPPEWLRERLGRVDWKTSGFGHVTIEEFQKWLAGGPCPLPNKKH